MLEALSFTSTTVPLGTPWLLRVLATDAEGVASGTEPAITVDGPGIIGDVVTVQSTSIPGVFYGTYAPYVAGRHVAKAVSADGRVDFVAQVVEVTPNASMPTVASFNAWAEEHSHSDEDVQFALSQETDAQYRVCRVPAAYPNDLRGALYRRVQRALAMKALPLAVQETSDGETASQIVVPGNDPEVRRLERPWRRLPLG